MLMSEEFGKDPQTNAALQRRHDSYEHELVALGAQVDLFANMNCFLFCNF